MGLKHAIYNRLDGCYEMMSFNGRVRSTLLIARLSFLLTWAKGKNVRQHSWHPTETSVVILCFAVNGWKRQFPQDKG
jgi:hypothetical protein